VIDDIGHGLGRLSRPAALAIVAVTYLAAAAAGLAVAAATPGHALARTLAGDVAATLVVFAASMAVNNASLYDPYWSVAPPVIVAAWLLLGPDGSGPRRALVMALVAIWAVRLTANWATGWSGLSHEDWRYRMLRDTRGRWPWWLVNLGGIQLMPTLIVYIGLLPAWPAVTGERGLGVLDALAVAVTAGAIAIETVADLQLRRFSADPAHRGLVADVGLWRRSRHPNYLGEIGFWCGLYLFGLAAAPSWWWTVVGPLAMVGLFTAVSVPMMDRRSLDRRPGYAEYLRTTPALLPLPRRST